MDAPAADSAPDASEIELTSARKAGLPIVAGLLAIGGVLAWLLYRAGGPPGLTGWTQLALVAAAGVFAAAPPINRAVARLLDRLRHPSPHGRAWTAAAIWAAASLYLIATAHRQNRALYPRIHDECSYTIQARMLAEGKLWEPRHELADFFETFHFLTTPVYGSIYFPGTALMNVPGMWLRQPSWVIPLLLAALVVALSYRVSAEMVDGVAGLLVALLVLATRHFRTYSTMVMAQVPVMLLGLLMAWAYLRWRKERKWGWAVAIGAFAGWAAITRPVDALAFAIPVGLAMVWELRNWPRKRWAHTAIALLAGAVPFLELQVAFDWGVTGKPWKTPYVYYLEHNQPGSVFGSPSDQMARSESKLVQKQIYFAQLAATEKAERKTGLLPWLERRLRMTASVALPCAILLALFPAGLLLARDRGRWIMLATIPLYLLLYALNPFFLLHYAVPLTAAAALFAVLGARAVEGALAAPTHRRFAATFLTTALVLLAVGSLPQLNSRITDEPYRTPLLDYTQKALAQIDPPAVVLFRFTPGQNVHEEPVYNLDVTWPDDAPIIRAHDLGPRDGQLLRYYAMRQPKRVYWLFDRRDGHVYELGDAAQAAKALHVSLGPPPDLTADIR